MSLEKLILLVDFPYSSYRMDVRVHRTLMTRIERIDADLFRFYPLAGIAERMGCGEPSPLCFLETQSGEGSPHPIRSAIPVTAIAVFDKPVCNYALRHFPAIPYIQLIIALVSK